jgi:ankyrin repeat protein
MNLNRNRKSFICIILLILISPLSFASKQRWDDNKSDWSPLIKAVYKGEYKKIESLIKNDVDLNYHTKSGLTALSVSIRKQDTIAFDLLLNSGKIIKNDSQNLVMLACDYESLWIVKKLVANNYPIKNLEPQMYTPLMAACSFGSKEIVKYLIELKLDVNAQRKVDNMVPLMFAVGSGQPEKVKILLANGADKNMMDKNGKKAIDFIDYIPERMGISEKTKNEIRELLK